MEYPREFSPQARAKVEAAKLKARRLYIERRADVALSRYGSDHERNLREYILRVFLAFAEEACKLGSDGTFGADRIRVESTEFLRRFTIEAYYEDGYDRSGSRLGEMTSHWGGGLLARVEQEYRNSPDWQEYERLLLATAEKIARGKKRKAAATIGGTRRALVEAFLSKLAESGHKISRRDIWTVARYQDATEFERYQRNSPRTTQSAIDAFGRILAMSPEQFMKALANLRSK